VEIHICLSRGVQVVGAVWQAATRIVAGVGDLVQRIGDGRIGRVLGGETVEKSGDVVCGLHHARGDEEHECPGGASNPRSMVCQWFCLKTTRTVCQWFCLKTTGTVCQWFDIKTTGTVFSSLTSKPVATVFPGLTSKLVARVFWFGAQNRQLRFSDLGLKIITTVSWFGSENQVGDGLSVVPQNQWEDDSAWGTRRDLTACFT
jgi:hypothetical protein